MWGRGGGEGGRYRNLHGSSTADWTMICTHLALFLIMKSNEVVKLSVAGHISNPGYGGTPRYCQDLYVPMYSFVCSEQCAHGLFLNK